MENRYTKIILAVLSLILALGFELKFLASLGWSFDLFLLAVIIPAFFLDTAEFIFFGVFATFLSRLIYPFDSGGIFALMALPLVIFALKRILLWQSWFEPLLATALGILGFYALVGAPILANGFGFLAMDIAVSFAFAWGLYALFGRFTNNGRQRL
ncbi:MAG: hypothetical protein LiPW15_58 [Parcubacteria group bacterium LiPW_15]|nr:MAG: hypothetical protein LiPW15_58 [Parcubacteria group bacterium LiPW_15]